MFNLLKTIFGGGNNIVDKAAIMVDKLHFSEQEKTQLWIEAQKATAPQNLARRLIAVMIVGSYLLLILASALLYKIDFEYAKFLAELANENLFGIVMLVCGFYFMKRMLPSGDK
jgi:hypothetical protein